MEFGPSQKKAKSIKGTIRLLDKLLIRENLFISFCAVAFYHAGSILLKTPSNPILGSLVFWSTLFIYQINTKLKVNIADLTSFQKLKLLQKGRLITYILIILIVIAHLPFLSLNTTLYLAHLGIISTLYNVPKKEKLRSILPLRSVPFLKVFLIAYVWASISSILPAIFSEAFDDRIVMVFSAHFLFILAITLPFDIRDLKSDFGNQIVTVPNVIGISATKAIAFIALIFSVMILIYNIKSLAFLAILIVSGFLILNATPERKNHYYTIFIDGTIILYFATVKFLIY